MVRPSAQAKITLHALRDSVIEIMLDMPIWADAPVESLREVPLGVLRKSATQRHGVTRWRRGVNLEAMRVADVEVIDLHPQLLEDRWSAYAGFVLHHEYIHALGFRGHDSTFRSLESAWPGRTASRHAPEVHRNPSPCACSMVVGLLTMRSFLPASKTVERALPLPRMLNCSDRLCQS